MPLKRQIILSKKHNTYHTIAVKKGLIFKKRHFLNSPRQEESCNNTQKYSTL